MAACSPHALDQAQTEGEGASAGYYDAIPPYLLTKPHTLLVLDMNDALRSIEHAAPARGRLETQLGFRMVERIKAVDLVADYRQTGMGQGGPARRPPVPRQRGSI